MRADPTGSLIGRSRTFDWRARAIRGPTGWEIPFDDVRLKLSRAPLGHAVWARGPAGRGPIVGFFPDEEVALASRARLEHLMRKERRSEGAVAAHVPAEGARDQRQQLDSVHEPVSATAR